MTVHLRGMTWNHPRGIDPLIAQAAHFAKTRDVHIDWEARSLEDFEAFSVDALANQYDLMVIDHPHVGSVAASGSLVALDTVGRDLAPFVGQTVGRSHETYFYNGHQWALAIDAATQVAARVSSASSGAIAEEEWPRSWNEVIALARRKQVACALAPVHAMMCFYTLCANAGHPCSTDAKPFVDRDVATVALEQLRELASLIASDCFAANPIVILDQMGQSDSSITYTPLVYGYVSYSRDGFRPRRIDFGDMIGIKGSALGGTGIAVSARCANIEAALDVAFDLASAETQRTIYALNGGQPAHRQAWLDDAVNRDAHNFYRNTLATLDAAYHRPRFDGYIAFQATAGQHVADCLRGRTSIAACIDTLNDLYRIANRAAAVE